MIPAPSTDPARAAAPPAPLLPALGAILAGGASRRYGAPKALAPLGGTALAARIRDAVAAVVTRPVLITHLPELVERLGLPARPDATGPGGPLAGIDTALRWAEELALPGALCVACDLPFLSSPLLRAVVATGLETGSEVVVPESTAPTGIEPLCAWYSVSARPAVALALERGERSVVRLISRLGAHRIPLARVASFGDPYLLFLNVNTPEAMRRAEQVAGRPGAPHE